MSSHPVEEASTGEVSKEELVINNLLESIKFSFNYARKLDRKQQFRSTDQSNKIALTTILKQVNKHWTKEKRCTNNQKLSHANGLKQQI